MMYIEQRRWIDRSHKARQKAVVAVQDGANFDHGMEELGSVSSPYQNKIN